MEEKTINKIYLETCKNYCYSSLSDLTSGVEIYRGCYLGQRWFCRNIDPRNSYLYCPPWPTNDLICGQAVEGNTKRARGMLSPRDLDTTLPLSEFELCSTSGEFLAQWRISGFPWCCTHWQTQNINFYTPEGVTTLMIQLRDPF